MFTPHQLCTKFKKTIAECKKVALTIKTATGIKRFVEEKGYGSWFDDLFAIFKTCDACRPELSLEPSCSRQPDSDNTDTSSSSSTEIKEKLKASKLSKKKNDPIVEAIGLIKNAIENDPVKDMLSYLKEEAEKNREHEIKILQMVAQQALIQQAPMQQAVVHQPPMQQLNMQQSSAYQYGGGYYD